MCGAELSDPALIRKPLKNWKGEGGGGGRGPTPARLTLAALAALARPWPWQRKLFPHDSRPGD